MVNGPESWLVDRRFLRRVRRGLTLLALCAAAPLAAALQPSPAAPPDFNPAAEALIFEDAVQLTSRDRFLKAGEAYFDPRPRSQGGTDWIIFQAIEVPKEGQPPDTVYAMFAGKLVRGENDRVIGLDSIERLSPEGSANTCGWFHPTKPGVVLFGSTLDKPAQATKPGFQVGTNKYVWSFPDNMRLVERGVTALFEQSWSTRPGTDASKPAAPSTTLRPLFEKPGYSAEASWDPTGRFLLYANVNPDKAPTRPDKPDADLWIFDSVKNTHTALIVADGYDGGPFFSPDGSRICYRSDRAGDDKLQLYMAELVFAQEPDGTRVPIGASREFRLTDNEHVNWGPFWHPSGDFLVYATSQIGHSNYEVFALSPEKPIAGLYSGDAPYERLGTFTTDPEGKPMEIQTRRLSARTARVTHAAGADVLPAFSADGSLFMWTSQRGPKIESEARASSQLWIARWKADESSLFKKR